MQRIEDAIRVHHYMLQEKLPKEIQHRIDHIALIEKLLQSANPTPSELQLILNKVCISSQVVVMTDRLMTTVWIHPINEQNEDLKTEIARLTEKRTLQKDPTDDGMALYRQQSRIVGRKKETLAEELNQLRQELHTLEIQLGVSCLPALHPIHRRYLTWFLSDFHFISSFDWWIDVGQCI